MRSNEGDRRALRTVVSVGSVVTVLVGLVLLLGARATAATITASYAAGHRDMLINDYGTPALGTFVLRSDDGDPDPGTSRLALCVEAASAHATGQGAYQAVANRIESPALDYLVWKYGEPGTAEYVEIGDDHDTATALAALAWFHAGADRRGGRAVWANHAEGFAPVTPGSPHRWDALPRYGLASPVGLRAGSTDLDAAERRVLELFVEAEARHGPWQLGPVELHEGSVTVRITGPAGPIPHARGVRVDILAFDGSVIAAAVVDADADGVARVDLSDHDVPDLAAGGSIVAAATGPGVHREWDGDGEVQRMVTATSDALRAELAVAPTTTTTTTTAPPPPLQYLRVEKTSSDALFPAAGAEFELVDADGVPVALATTDDTGVVDLGPVDPARHQPPFRLSETRAPPGLRQLASELVLDGPFSDDPARPTIVAAVNHPLEGGLVVRKVLSDPDVGPVDRSGFEFSVTRLADGRDHGTWATDADGRTMTVALTLGAHRVCEVGRPHWAESLIDTGCREVVVDEVTIDHADPASPHEIEYVNAVPDPSISTRLRDRTDGDAVVEHAADGVVELVDEVSLGGLVPGTAYVLRGSVGGLDGAGGITAPLDTVALEVVPESTTAEIEMILRPVVPPGLVALVAYQQLLVGDRLVAEHADPADVEQTVTLVELRSEPEAPAPTTATPTTAAAPTTSVPAATPVRPAVPGPRSLPGTGAKLVASLVTVAVGVLGVGLAAVTWSAAGPWSGVRTGRRRRRGRR